MESIVGEFGFMAASAGKAFLTLMEPHRLMFLGLGCIMGLVLGIIPGIGTVLIFLPQITALSALMSVFILSRLADGDG